VALFEKAVDCRPPSSAHRAATLLTLADLLTELGRSDEANRLYETAHREDPSHPWAAYRVGMLQMARGETDQAARTMLSVARNPYARKKSATAMAELSRRAGRLTDAAGFDAAAERLPPDAFWANPFTAAVGDQQRGRRALMDRYVSQESAGDDRGAVRTGGELADQYPSIETQMLLLRALVNAGQYPAALAAGDDILRDADGRKLVTVHSFLGLAKLGLADQAEAVGRKAEADKWRTEAAAGMAESVRLKPDYAPGYMYQARALTRLGKLSEAEVAARAGVKVRPEEWEGYLALSEVLAAAGRKAEALAAAEQAAKFAHPDEPRTKQALAELKK
jgi:tetratricopeptide (TPR) repeat protein